MQLLEALLDMVSDGVMMTDLQGRIQRVNTALCKMTGYASHELEMKKPSCLKSNRHDEKFYQRLWETLGHRQEWYGSIWNRRKNGEVFASWVWIRPLIHEETGAAERYVAVYSYLPHHCMEMEEAGFVASHYDILTGLPNRLFFEDKLQVSLAIAKRHVTRFAVVYMNLDSLKSINALLGYHIGDAVLQQVAKRLQNRVREVDIVSRIQKDEFAVIVTEVRRMEDIIRITRTIHKWLQTPFSLTENTVTISASTGIAVYPDDSQECSELVGFARMAMLQSKAAGQGRICFYSQTETET